MRSGPLETGSIKLFGSLPTSNGRVAPFLDAINDSNVPQTACRITHTNQSRPFPLIQFQGFTVKAKSLVVLLLLQTLRRKRGTLHGNRCSFTFFFQQGRRRWRLHRSSRRKNVQHHGAFHFFHSSVGGVFYNLSAVKHLLYVGIQSRMKLVVIHEVVKDGTDENVASLSN